MKKPKPGDLDQDRIRYVGMQIPMANGSTIKVVQTGETPLKSVDGPRCDKCGAPVETGLIAVFCPHGDDCEFFVEEHADTIHEMRAKRHG